MSIIPSVLPAAYPVLAIDQETQRNRAACLIQKVFRAHLVALDFAKGRKLIDEGSYAGAPRASCGRTPVYFPKDAPRIILKHSGVPDNARRLARMVALRTILQFPDFKHLVIPKAQVHKEFLIEERLPFHINSLTALIGFYHNNLAALQGVVEEFTRLCCFTQFSDLCCSSYFLNKKEGTLFARFDNAPLYIKRGPEGDRYCMGLIDLEYLRFGRGDWEKSVIAPIVFFPDHFSRIWEIAESCLGPCHPDTQRSLQTIRDDVKAFHEVYYLNPRTVLRRKGISLDNPYKQLVVSEATVERVAEIVFEKIMCFIAKNFPPKKAETFHSEADSLDSSDEEDPANNFVETLDREVAKSMVRAVVANINKHLDEASRKSAAVTSEEEILLVRCGKFSFDGIEIRGIPPYKGGVISRNFVINILEELFKAKEIAGVWYGLSCHPSIYFIC